MSEEPQLRAAPEDHGKTQRNTTLWTLSVFSLVYLGVLGFSLFQTAPCVPDWWGPQNPPEGFVDTFIKCRTSNEIGDFLAGAFAPLAFLWLAGAVLIQSRELRAQKEELSLTRGEMIAMRKVATAQAAEARASKEFIGKQTEIMQRRLELEQLDDLTEEFLVRTLTFETLLNRFEIQISYRYMSGKIENFSLNTGPDIPVYRRADELIDMINRWSKNHRELFVAGDLRNSEIKTIGAGSLDEAREELLTLLPKLSAVGKARAAEKGLDNALKGTTKLLTLADEISGSFKNVV